EDAHFMVCFVTFFQSAQDGYRILRVWFFHHHLLEPTFERLVFLEVFLVFVERGGTDGTQLATGEGRLEDIRGIHGAFTTARTDKGVYLIDEQDDFAITLCYLFYHRLEPFFKLTLVFCSGDQCPHIEGEDRFPFEVFRHVAFYDAVSDAFGNRGLAHAWLAN